MTLRGAGSRGWLLPILLLVTACERGRAVAEPQLDKPALALSGRVVDAAGILTDDEERLLTAKLAALEAHDGVQFVVATTPSLAGEGIDTYARRLGNAWGLGSKERNDGLLLLVAPNERRVQISVGLGLEKRLPDADCKQIIEERITPRFRQSDMAGGINAGADALIGALKASEAAPRKKAA